MFVFYRLRKYVNRTMITSIYKALGQSILEYGIIGWGAANTTNLRPAITIQKLILKVLLNKHKQFSQDLVFQETEVLDVRQLYIKRAMIHVFKNYKLYKFELSEIQSPLHKTRSTL